jgi:outer membrane receptor for Fe3+-dicitrate
MSNKNKNNELPTLHRALKIAAIEAYLNEIVEQGLLDKLVGTGKRYTNENQFIKEKIERWKEEAELYCRNKYV